MPMAASPGASDGIAASIRAPSSSRSIVATTNGTRSLNGGTPFWRMTVYEYTVPSPLAVTHSSVSRPQCEHSKRG